MHINDNRKPKTIKFWQLNPGEVFYDVYNTQFFCIKIKAAPEDINAINLESGCAYTFDNDDEVEVVIATMNIS